MGRAIGAVRTGPPAAAPAAPIQPQTQTLTQPVTSNGNSATSPHERPAFNPTAYNSASILALDTFMSDLSLSRWTPVLQQNGIATVAQLAAIEKSMLAYIITDSSDVLKIQNQIHHLMPHIRSQQQQQQQSQPLAQSSARPQSQATFLDLAPVSTSKPLGASSPPSIEVDASPRPAPVDVRAVYSSVVGSMCSLNRLTSHDLQLLAKLRSDYNLTLSDHDAVVTQLGITRDRYEALIQKGRELSVSAPSSAANSLTTATQGVTRAAAIAASKSTNPFTPDSVPSTPVASATAPTNDLASAPASQGTGECVVCLDALSCYVLVPCGHLCLCEKCSRLFTVGSDCPKCRAVIVQSIKAYV